MGKFLRVLVVLLLVLSIGSLAFGIMLFMKRELLKGRTQKLEKTIREFDAFIEDVPGTADAATYPERDTSPCTEDVLAEPERATFWSAYNADLEVQIPESMVNNSDQERQMQLMSYYQIDPATGKKVTNLATGQLVTDGVGTMQEILTDLLDKADAQYELLNQTRQQLETLRKEYVNTIQELNTTKNDLRLAKKKIRELEDEITRLKQKIVELEEKITELEEQNRQLQDEITTLTSQLEIVQEQLEEMTRKNAELEQELAAYRTGGNSDVAQGSMKHITEGAKGTVASINREWNFVVINLTDEFITEVYSKDNVDKIDLPLWIARPGKKKSRTVTKVRLVQIRQEEKLGIANILSNYIQSDIKVGDSVTF